MRPKKENKFPLRPIEEVCAFLWLILTIFVFRVLSRRVERAHGDRYCVPHPLKGALCVCTPKECLREIEGDGKRECAQNAPRERSDITAYSMCMCVTRLLGPISCVCVCRSKLLLFWEKAAQKCACRVRETKMNEKTENAKNVSG